MQTEKWWTIRLENESKMQKPNFPTHVFRNFEKDRTPKSNNENLSGDRWTTGLHFTRIVYMFCLNYYDVREYG